MSRRVHFNAATDIASVENGTREPLLRQESFTNTYRRSLVPASKEKSKLITAVYDQNEDQVKNLLTTENANPNNEVASNFLSPLEIAVGKENLNIVRLLLDHDANIDVKNDDIGSTPLHIAVKRKRSENVELLLARGASYTAVDAKKRRPSDIAASLGHTEIFIKIYRHACSETDDNCARDQILRTFVSGVLPIHYACMGGHEDLASFILDTDRECFKVRKNRGKGETPLIMAARNGYPACCRILLEAAGDERLAQLLYVDQNTQTTALVAAAKNGHASTLPLLTGSDLSFGVNGRNTALHYASLNGYLKTVRQLLSMGCSPLKKNSKGDTCLHVATRKRSNIACIKALLESAPPTDKPIVNEQGKTFLHMVAENCYDVLNEIVQYDFFRAQINELDKEGRSPFHRIIMTGNIDAFNIMLHNGADLRNVTTRGDLPLHIAARKGCKDMCALLLREEQRTTVNQRNYHGATSLHHAIYNTDEKEAVAICEFLLHKGASLHIEDSLGFTPLSIAVHNKRSLLVKVFIKHGGLNDISPKFVGDNYLHIAARNGDYDTCKAIVTSKEPLLKCRNRLDQLPLQVAFDMNHLEIFSLFLQKLKFNEKEKQMLPFRNKLHDFMRDALKNSNCDLMRVMIHSNKWDIAIHRSPTEESCKHFRDLIRVDSGLACDVMTKCICPITENRTRYNFDLFEDTFIIHHEKHSHPSLGNFPIYLSPFDEATGKLKKKCNKIQNIEPHPLKIAIEHGCFDVLTHKLTIEYLKEKWKHSVFYVYFSLLIVEIMSTLIQGCNLSYSIDAHLYINGSCGQPKENMYPSDILQYVTGSWLVIHLILEINFFCKLQLGLKYMTRPIFWLKSLRNLLLLLSLLLPPCLPSIDKSLKIPVGCIAFLLTSLLCILFINEIPLLSISITFSKRFVYSFVRVLSHVIFGVLSFALVFSVLLSDFSAFSSLYRSLIKTSTWLMIDLSYDDTFVEKNPRYQVLTELIFILFVMTFGLFIINALVSMPSDHWQNFKNEALIKRAASRAQLILELDQAFCKHVVKFVEPDKIDGSRYFSMLFEGEVTSEDSQTSTKETINDVESEIQFANREELCKIKFRKQRAITVLQNEVRSIEDLLKLKK